MGCDHLASQEMRGNLGESWCIQNSPHLPKITSEKKVLKSVLVELGWRFFVCLVVCLFARLFVVVVVVFDTSARKGNLKFV